MNTNSPTPYGPIPSARQLAWHAYEYYGFLHFTVNTFTNREWGQGNEEPACFLPTNFNASQIATSAAMGGMKGLILTAKHHDGFCLWPSDYTEHSVKNSPWRNGKGDVVGELAEACREKGILFGVYLSPWDRNHPDYARPEYIQYYRNQLRELLSNYGSLFEVWFDGANGGDGYYGGKYEKRTIDAKTYYEWDKTFTMIRELQPNAVIFGGVPGSDIRWVGNEGGIAGDPCWHTYPAGAGEDAGIETLNQGVRSGEVWFPAECDVSIRPGWFFHQRENLLVRTPQNLLDLYFQSVGRGASLLLNLPPDRRGQIPRLDVASLAGFKQLREQLFACDLAKGAKIIASHTRGDLDPFSAKNMIDGNPNTYWCPEDDQHQAELIFEFDRKVNVNVAGIREHLPLGQRIDAFAIDAGDGGDWKTIFQGESIGNRRLVRFPEVSCDRVRLRILKAAACPVIQEFALYCGDIATQ